MIFCVFQVIFRAYIVYNPAHDPEPRGTSSTVYIRMTGKSETSWWERGFPREFRMVLLGSGFGLEDGALGLLGEPALREPVDDPLGVTLVENAGGSDDERVADLFVGDVDGDVDRPDGVRLGEAFGDNPPCGIRPCVPR